jgi:hypothetical protein
MAENLEGLIRAVVQLGMKQKGLTDLAKTFSKDPTNYKSIENYAQMLYGDVTQGLGKTAYEDLKKASPALVRENMDLSIGEAKATIGKVVGENYEAVVASLDDQATQHAALAASGKAKEAEAIMEALKAEKYDELREKYAKFVASKGFKAHAHYIKNVAGAEFFKMYSNYYLQASASEFLKDFLLPQKGEEEPKLDSKKLKAYLLEAPSKAKDDKARDAFYADIGGAISDYHVKIAELARKQAEAAEKAKAEEKKGK